MKIFEELGQIAIGTRIRYLSEKITEDAAKIYGLYGIEMNPKWFPVFFVLSKSRERSVTSIAKDIGHSHASVSKIVKELMEAHLVCEKTSGSDRRRTMVGLSKVGKGISKKIENQYADVRAAMERICSQSKHDLWRALEEWECLLEQQSLFIRVAEQKKKRESSGVRIVPYTSKYRAAFRNLNLAWIKAHFKVERADRDALDEPEQYILDRGGHIFVAIFEDKPVGVCALLKRNDSKYPYELAKMAVDPKARGMNIGWMLGRAVVEKAKSLKADRLYLESNTILTPAIGLYKKLGFKKAVGSVTPYERCNIQMELSLNS
jgi:GNAT superfamily N-acetyltransferase/DNA-binding MarR family transcriptional regulator